MTRLLWRLKEVTVAYLELSLVETLVKVSCHHSENISHIFENLYFYFASQTHLIPATKHLFQSGTNKLSKAGGSS